MSALMQIRKGVRKDIDNLHLRVPSTSPTCCGMDMENLHVRLQVHNPLEMDPGTPVRKRQLDGQGVEFAIADIILVDFVVEI